MEGVDLELLNFWIHKLHLEICQDGLRLKLKACAQDFLHSFTLPVSKDPVKILAFLGYDTEVDITKLTEKNLFEYLCTSTRLNPKFIAYTSFKGPHAKNALHARFNDYLKEKGYPLPRSLDNNDKKELEALSKELRDHAIEFFEKQDEILAYAQKYQFITKVFEQRQHLPTHTMFDFNRFIVLYGLKAIATMETATLQKRWNNFTKSNWSQLDLFC